MPRSPSVFLRRRAAPGSRRFLPLLGLRTTPMPDTLQSFCLHRALASTLTTLHLEPVSNVADQVRAARESVLLVAEPDLAVLVVTGSDRATWLNGLVTCDVVKLEEGD